MADNHATAPTALIADLPEDDEAEQLDLLGLPQVAVELGRRRGRPAGAKNRATADWVEMYRRRYSDPLERLAHLANAPIDVLARELNAKRLDAADFQRKILDGLMPYFHTRQPIAVDLTSRRVINLTIEIGELGAAGDGDPLAGATLIAH